MIISWNTPSATLQRHATSARYDTVDA